MKNLDRLWLFDTSANCNTIFNFKNVLGFKVGVEIAFVHFILLVGLKFKKIISMAIIR